MRYTSGVAGLTVRVQVARESAKMIKPSKRRFPTINIQLGDRSSGMDDDRDLDDEDDSDDWQFTLLSSFKGPGPLM